VRYNWASFYSQNLKGGLLRMRGLEGIRCIEVGGMAAMPLAGMIMSCWGAEVIHVEPPGRGDFQRQLLGLRAAGQGPGSQLFMGTREPE